MSHSNSTGQLGIADIMQGQVCAIHTGHNSKCSPIFLCLTARQHFVCIRQCAAKQSSPKQASLIHIPTSAGIVIRGERNERKFEYSLENRIGEQTNSHIHVRTAKCTCISYMYMTVRFLIPTSCAAARRVLYGSLMHSVSAVHARLAQYRRSRSNIEKATMQLVQRMLQKKALVEKGAAGRIGRVPQRRINPLTSSLNCTTEHTLTASGHNSLILHTSI